MGIFSQITETFRYLVSEKLLSGLRILTGKEEIRRENRENAPVSTATPDKESLNTAPMEENAKPHLSSNQLGWRGKRG